MAKFRDTNEFDYDVCLSFAGEDRGYVEPVADGLRQRGIRVFYDRYEQVELWGKDLYTHLDDVYRSSARYCIMFVSRHYGEKLWTNHERQSAQARAFEENAEYVLPARLDDTEIPGVRPTIGYVDLKTIGQEQFIAMIVTKIGERQTTNFFPPVPDRLYEDLKPKTDDDKSQIYSHAIKFFDILRRMSDEERTVAFKFFTHSCPAELPENVHINIDLLRRYTEFPIRKIKRILGKIQSLGFYTTLRDDTETNRNQIGKAKMLVLEWHNMSVEDGGNATGVAFEIVHGATKDYCEEHGFAALNRLDFSQLAVVTTVIDEH